MSSGKKAQPKFDFSRVGKKWQEEFSQSAEVATRASFTIQRPLRKQRKDEDDDDYGDYVQKFYDDKESAVDQVKAMGDVQTKLVVQVLADVPRTWLLGNAPDVIDWGDVASLDYIQSDYYEELLDMVRTGGARKNAKN